MAHMGRRISRSSRFPMRRLILPPTSATLASRRHVAHPFLTARPLLTLARPSVFCIHAKLFLDLDNSGASLIGDEPHESLTYIFQFIVLMQ